MYKQLRPPTSQILKATYAILKIKFPEVFVKPVVLDMFAGSGSFGILMLQKAEGSYCVFVEKAFDSCLTLNKTCRHKFPGRFKVVRSDALRVNLSTSFDLIFIDPPYRFNMSSKMLQMAEKQPWIKENTLVCLRKDIKEELRYNGRLEIVHEYVTGYNQTLFLKLKREVLIEQDSCGISVEEGSSVDSE